MESVIGSGGVVVWDGWGIYYAILWALAGRRLPTGADGIFLLDL